MSKILVQNTTLVLEAFTFVTTTKVMNLRLSFILILRNTISTFK